jgi:uncharacterized protein YneR
MKYHIPRSLSESLEEKNAFFFIELNNLQNEKIKKLSNELLIYKKDILHHQWDSSYEEISEKLQKKFSQDDYIKTQKKIVDIFYDINNSSLTDSISLIKTVYKKRINGIPIFIESQDVWSFNGLKNKWELLKTAEFVP